MIDIELKSYRSLNGHIRGDVAKYIPSEPSLQSYDSTGGLFIDSSDETCSEYSCYKLQWSQEAMNKRNQISRC